MNKQAILVTFMLGLAIPLSSYAENVTRLHCGDLGAKDPINKTLHASPLIKITANNITDNFFLIIDFDNKKISQYPYLYTDEGKPLFDENKKQSTSIAPITNKILESQGVSYITWAAFTNLGTNLDEFIYISSKVKLLGKEDYFGGLLTKVETTIIDNDSTNPKVPIKSSVTIKQFLCSKIFDFSSIPTM